MAYSEYVRAHNMVYVNGVGLPNPSKMSIQTYDGDSGEGAGRNQDFQMIRDRVAVKEKLVMEFPPMLQSDYEYMLRITDPQTFQVRYFSPKHGGWYTTTAYAGDREANIYYMYDAQNPGKSLLSGVSMNIIEC